MYYFTYLLLQISPMLFCTDVSPRHNPKGLSLTLALLIARTETMGGIKQEQSDASQQPKPSHSADQPQEEVGAAGSVDCLTFVPLVGGIRLSSFAAKYWIDCFV